MSLLDTYKKAATRVAQYLGEHHRVKIPRTSALEVVAQAHGARNWQTLAASASSSSGRELQSPTEARGYPVQWGVYGNPTLLSRQDWFRHITVIGTSAKREEWFATQLTEHLSTNRAGLFIGLDDLPGMDRAIDSFVVLHRDDIANLTSEVVNNVADGGCWYVSESNIDPASLSGFIYAVAVARRERRKPVDTFAYTIAVVDEESWRVIPDSVYRQARSFNVALLVGADKPLQGHAGGNVWNQLYLSQPEQVLKFAEKRLAESDSALCNPDSIRFA